MTTTMSPAQQRAMYGFLAPGETRTAAAPGIRIELFHTAAGAFTTVAVRNTTPTGPATLFSDSRPCETPQIGLFAKLCAQYGAELA